MLLPPGGPQCEWVGEVDWCETGAFPFPGFNSTPFLNTFRNQVKFIISLFEKVVEKSPVSNVI